MYSGEQRISGAILEFRHSQSHFGSMSFRYTMVTMVLTTQKKTVGYKETVIKAFKYQLASPPLLFHFVF